MTGVRQKAAVKHYVRRPRGRHHKHIVYQSKENTPLRVYKTFVKYPCVYPLLSLPIGTLQPACLRYESSFSEAQGLPYSSNQQDNLAVEGTRPRNWTLT